MDLLLVDQEGGRVGFALTPSELANYVGKQVTIWAGVGDRNSYQSQISVCGILEQHPEQEDNFRIVAEPSDPKCGTYTYFETSDIEVWGEHPEGQTFQDGSRIAIKLKF